MAACVVRIWADKLVARNTSRSSGFDALDGLQMRWRVQQTTMNTDTGAQLREQYANQGGVSQVFSAKVEDYLASRPGYPAALFRMLATQCALPPHATVADVGAGTGLLTQGFLQRGYRAFAVEPNAQMRCACDSLLGAHAHYQSVDGQSVDGSAESTGLTQQSVDLVSAAQAFHWFDIAAARAEFLRVLRPTGQVALIWNDRVLTDALHVALDEVFAEFGGAKRGALLAHEERHAVPQFFGAGPYVESLFANEHQLSEQGLLSLVLSRSYMPAKSTPQGREVASRVSAVFAAHATGAEQVTVRYQTIAIVGRPA
jgi:SAM-dependent methyltransferase